VRIQIAVALIAFLILHMLKETTKAKHGFLELVRLVRTNLMHRKDFARLAPNTDPAASRFSPARPRLGKYMNRTAVGQARA